MCITAVFLTFLLYHISSFFAMFSMLFLLSFRTVCPPRPTKITKKYTYVLVKMTGLILAYSSSYILSKFGLFEIYFSDFRFLSSEVYFEIFHNISLKLCLFYYLNTT